MGDTDSEDERVEIQKQYRKYLKSLVGFRAVLPDFEEEIPRISELPWVERMDYVIQNYEKHLKGLHGRPKGMKMRTLQSGINEFQTFCTALRIGWKLWPDWWTGLQMMLDYLSEDTQTEDLEGLDFQTLAVLKEIAKCENWPNNQRCGPRMTAPQAKCILIRFERKCSFSGATGNPSFGQIGVLGFMSFVNPMSTSMNSLKQIVSFRICDGITCFKVETQTVKFKMCGRCKKMFYCSTDCQKSSWKGGHKKECHS